MKDEAGGTNQKARIIGIDYGAKRVGIAVSDEGRQFALPLAVIANTRDLVAEIRKIAALNQSREIVIGESRDYRGEPNAILADVDKFKKDLESDGFIVHYEPEFMTTMQAERLQGKHDKIDASAAAIILQSFIDKIKNV